MERLAAAAEPKFVEAKRKMEQHASSGTDVLFEDETIASRGSTKRYEVKLPYLEAPFNASAVVDDETLIGMIKLFLMNGAIALDTYSAVVSVADCPEGSWHADVEDPFAFHQAVVRSARHPPPPGLVAIVPLVDVNMSNGPTAFRMGSPALGSESMWDRGEVASSDFDVSIDAKVGTAVLFDLRTVHRGGANRGKARYDTIRYDTIRYDTIR